LLSPEYLQGTIETFPVTSAAPQLASAARYDVGPIRLNRGSTGSEDGVTDQAIKIWLSIVTRLRNWLTRQLIFPRGRIS
jgi:hypothetical protein